MCDCQKETNLGFADEKVTIGTHLCIIFSSEEERRESLLKFLLSGLQSNERSACFSEKVTEDELRKFFKENSINYDERKEKNEILLSGTGDVYFSEGRFDPDRMINLLKNYYDETQKLGLDARVIGEMLPEVQTIPGGDRLTEYESKVNLLVKTHPITSVCQYDANVFDGATIMEVLKVHPKMLVNGAVVQNPFFIEPEIYLKQLAEQKS
jgi:hypothetical protein